LGSSLLGDKEAIILRFQLQYGGYGKPDRPRDIVRIECLYKVAYGLSFGTDTDDLE